MNNGTAGEMPTGLFRVFADLLRDRCGLHFTEVNRFLLESRIAARVRELRLTDVRGYLHRLRYGVPGQPDEMDALIDRVTNPETYFFREPEQIDAFAEEVLPEWESQAAPGSKLKIWSAGCASGEEPYTLAMLLDEKKFYERYPLEIFASDISLASLSRARAGVYRENSFRQTSPERRARFFEEEAPGRYRIREEIRNRATFGRVNLIESARLVALPEFDVIFCRNVLIYLHDPAKRAVVNSLYERLRPGGYLFLGRVESLVAAPTAFRLRHLKRDMVYQR